VHSPRSIKFLVSVAAFSLAAAVSSLPGHAQVELIPNSPGARREGRRLFSQETFGGNGRTCLSCHSLETGTVSPEEAQLRFALDPYDPLFLHDGSDDRHGHGVSRMLKDATILVEIPLPANVSLADDPHARSVILKRGIPSTLNTPSVDPVLMLDGRQADLQDQALGAVRDHFQATVEPSHRDLRLIADFQQTEFFFSSPAILRFARNGKTPELPEGRTESEKRGRHFFLDTPLTSPSQKAGSCAVCHSGPMLNETNQFLPLPVPAGTRFLSAGVSEFNEAKNEVREFVFKNPDGSSTSVKSPDPGRALITGVPNGFTNANAFKIPSLWGVSRTAPYFHDNSAKTLEEVVAHYKKFFLAISNPKDPLLLTDQDIADIVAYLKLLN
jgi:cytochrome c peroxidase